MLSNIFYFHVIDTLSLEYLNLLDLFIFISLQINLLTKEKCIRYTIDKNTLLIDVRRQSSRIIFSYFSHDRDSKSKLKPSCYRAFQWYGNSLNTKHSRYLIHCRTKIVFSDKNHSHSFRKIYSIFFTFF
jgi:hypothetical protein